ncbi:MAG TPA: class I SAM-dependent methyltransferase [candidate division Zixibacteria bacterium]|nr:class I SAM-dependent methyltransferase [candidate division Zixibacteria bacterium]
MDEQLLRRPSKRRIKRIRIYRSLVGLRQRVLELGCGAGDLTCALAEDGEFVAGSDLSFESVRSGKARLLRDREEPRKVAFVQMDARALAFADAAFDVVVSTSMIEHLYPDDLSGHLSEVWRVLKIGGRYLVWCPNGLGRHRHRDFHYSMFSYREWMEKMRAAGFGGFESLLFHRPLFRVDAGWKVRLEEFLSRWRLKILWSHLGVRNVLLLARKEH